MKNGIFLIIFFKWISTFWYYPFKKTYKVSARTYLQHILCKGLQTYQNVEIHLKKMIKKIPFFRVYLCSSLNLLHWNSIYVYNLNKYSFTHYGHEDNFLLLFLLIYQLISKYEIERFLILELQYEHITEKLRDTKIKYDKV